MSLYPNGGKRTAAEVVTPGLAQAECYRCQPWKHPSSPVEFLSSGPYTWKLWNHTYSLQNCRYPTTECKCLLTALGYSDSVGSTHPHSNKLAQKPPYFDFIRLSPQAVKAPSGSCLGPCASRF